MVVQNISRGEYHRFFSSLGFDDDPFAYTNADQEERLQEYFISPPYFNSVFGDPEKPKSFVVFAPRGGGKSAQRRMIEEKCQEQKILSITIDQFEFPEVTKAKDVTLAHHLKRIIRNIIIGILFTINQEPALKLALSSNEQETLVKLSKEFIGNITEDQLKSSLESLKSLKIKLQEFWNEWLPMISLGMNAFLGKFLNADSGSFEKYTNSTSINISNLKYILHIVIQLSKKIGYKSIYVLIDRVDEAELTGNSSANSFTLISPLLSDLELLEMDGIGFKFFLWDELEPAYNKIARTDRIRTESLEWKDNMLLGMWEKRLRAYSHGKINSLNQLSIFNFNITVDRLALIFANQSPRDMIRIGQNIFAEQMEHKAYGGKINDKSIISGVEKFCFTRANEVVTPKTLNDLRKTQKVDFTIPYLANIVFHEDQTTTRNRIMRWRNEGAIVEVDRVDNPNPEQKTQVKLFAIQDVRLAKVVYSDLPLLEFLRLKFKQCPKCETKVIREWGGINTGTRCHDCQYDLADETTQDDIPGWKREAIAKATRKKSREDRYEYNQKSLFDLEES